MSINDQSVMDEELLRTESFHWIEKWIHTKHEGTALKPTLKVFYIEDEEADVTLLKTALLSNRRHLYEFESASSLASALEIFGRKEFDICLADLSLPDADGVEVVETLREQFPKMALVVVSGNQDEKVALDSLANGAHDYLYKGEIEADNLDRAIRYAMERCALTAELLEQRIRAEESSIAKSQFLSNMSHEIRTPLNSIIGISSLLQETTLDIQQGQYVEMLIKSGRHLLELINNTLDLSRIEAGEVDVSEDEFELVRLVENMADIAATNCRVKGLDFCLSVSPKSNIRVVSDERKIRQILFNLIGNAIKFTSEGHLHLDVKAEPGEGKTGRVTFALTDTGIGIDSSKFNEIFQDFTQADATITRKFGGSGLGLSLCKRFADLLGGRISVESEGGKGSTFTLQIPATVNIGEKVGSALTDQLKDTSVVIVDDNPIERKILADEIEGFGAKKITSLENATEFLNYIKTNGAKDDLYFIDCRMSPLGGFETLQKVLDVVDIRNRVVMMLPKGHRGSDLQRLRDFKLKYYFVKPIKLNQLRSLFEGYLKGVNHLDVSNAPQKATFVQLPKLRILIAEDVKDNQFLLKAYFKGTPHRIDFADNGVAALNKAIAIEYDVILMDLQMPEMDGFTATEKIREHEVKNQRSRVPILALTAHAFKSELQHAIEMGCDDCLSKPVGKQALMEKLFQIVKGNEKEKQVAEGETERDNNSFNSSAPVIDHAFLQQYDDLDEPGEPKVVDQMFELFKDSAPKRVKAIGAAINQGDAVALRHEAHAFKSSSGNIGAMRLRALCEELEHLGAKGNLDVARNKFQSLDGELNKVLSEMGQEEKEDEGQSKAA